MAYQGDAGLLTALNKVDKWTELTRLFNLKVISTVY